MKKRLSFLLGLMLVVFTLLGCGGATSGTKADVEKTINTANKLQQNQPTPTDIEYSLERYNLVKRAYWVNGQREKAQILPTPISSMPLGYIVLFTDNGGVVGKFIVEGKVSSLNSYLTPSVARNMQGGYDIEMPDIDGSYGTNDNGIFFFTPDGKYIEWTGAYLYSDIPFEVSNPIVKVSTGQ